MLTCRQLLWLYNFYTPYGIYFYKRPYTATVVEKLQKHGAVVLGKTNMDEFGMGSFNLNSAYGATAGLRSGGT